MSERVLAKGQILFVRGDAPEWMFCVAAGELRLVRTLETGAEMVLQRCRRGVLAEGSLDQIAYHCDAVAAVASRVVAVPRAAFREALDEPGFRDFWLGYITRELRHLRSQNERLGLRTGRERILHFIDAEGCNGSLVLTQSKKTWASELGLSHEALYRTLKLMARNRELTIEGRCLRRIG